MNPLLGYSVRAPLEAFLQGSIGLSSAGKMEKDCKLFFGRDVLGISKLSQGTEGFHEGPEDVFMHSQLIVESPRVAAIQ